jgi:serine/threonine-protein kinase
VREEDPLPPRRLNHAIPRDLETVCLKAMAKEPLQRYSTAGALAAELGRVLRDEPVQARPAGAVVALARRCRRRPLFTAAVAALVLLFIAGGALLSGTWLRSRRFQSQAAARLAEAEQLRAQRLQMVESGYQTAMRLAQMARSHSPEGLAGVTGRSDATDAILRDLRGFHAQLRTEPAFRPQLGSALIEYGSVAQGLGRREEASAGWQEAKDIYEELLRSAPDDAALLTRLGVCHNGLYQVGRMTGRGEEAGRHARLAGEQWRRAIGLLEAALRLHPNDVAVGSLLLDDGPSPEALGFLLAARQSHEMVCRTEPTDVISRADLATCLYTLGAYYQTAGRWAEARQVLEQNRREWENLLAIHPGLDHYRDCLAETIVSLARVHRSEGHLEEALGACAEALPIWEDLLRRDPSNLQFHWGLARASFWRGAALDRLGRPAEALPYYETAAEHFARPSRQDTPKLGSLGASYHVIGRLRNDLGMPLESALSAFREALKVRELLCQRGDNGPGEQSDCAGTWQRLGETLERLGRDREAAEAYRQAIAQQTTACTRDPSSRKYAQYLDGHRASLARLEGKLAACNGSNGIP